MTRSTMLQSKKGRINEKAKKVGFVLLKILSVSLFWFAIWFLVAKKIDSQLILPAPKDVFLCLGNLITKAEFWLFSFASLLRIACGILISFLIGVFIAIATTRFKIMNMLLSPLLTVMKSTPIASFIILAFVWMHTDIIPIFITSLIVIPMVWSNISEGILAVDPLLSEVTKIYRFSRLKKLTRLYIPTIAPYFMATCKSALGMAWKAGIAAEILAPPESSIGGEIIRAKRFLEMPTMFAWTLVVILLSLLFEKIFVLGIEKLGKRFRFFSQGGPHADR